MRVGVVLQLAAQHPQGEVAEVVGTLVRLDEVGRERGVARQPGQGPATSRQRLRRPLGVVQDLRPVGVGEPAGNRLLGRLVEVGHLEVCRVAVGRGDGQGPHVAGAPGPLADDRDADALTHPGVVGEPAGHLGAREDDAVDVEAGLGLHGHRLQGREEPLAQHPELQPVEDGVDLLAVPGLALEVPDLHREVHVTDQLVESPVAQDAVKVLAQRLPGLATDLVDVRDDARQVDIQTDPLRGGLGPHPGDSRQVVGGLADEGCQVAVALRRHAVLRLDRRRGQPGQLRDALDGVEERDLVGDELDRVAVARADEDLDVLRGGQRRQGRDDVVGLVALGLDVTDLQRIEHLVQERDLALELVRRRRAPGLVFGIFLQAEGLARDVEGDRHVGRLLVPQQVDQHRREAVDRVGVLARPGREVLGREGEEGTVGQRMSVEQEEATHVLQPRPRPRRTPTGGAPVASSTRGSARGGRGRSQGVQLPPRVAVVSRVARTRAVRRRCSTFSRE